MRISPHQYLFVLTLIYSSVTHANYKDDIGYTQLATELGVNLPDGSGVQVSQTEADTDGVAGSPYQYFPDTTDAQFIGKTIINVTNLNNTPSGHASSVGKRFYGTNSMANGITNIDVYEVTNWIQGDFLRWYVSSRKPLASSNRVGNHSWVGSFGSLLYDSQIVRRLDWVIETDEFVQFVGTRNSTGLNYNLLSAAYNVMAVGRTDGSHSTGSRQLDNSGYTDNPSAVYVAGRTRTEIVAPLTTTSAATPVIAATAAILIGAGKSNPGLSNGSTSNRNGDIIYNAERSETIKAALLAGADRFTKNTSTTANISDYRLELANQSANGLDARFGAGQVNVYNSYQIIAAGEQDSSEDGGTGSIGMFGFDYDSSFGGSSGSNNVASYYFSTDTGSGILSASLAWNIDIAGGNGTTFDGTAIFYDLDLHLYDVTAGQTLLMSSTSSIDNTENIWVALQAGRNYLLQVKPKAGQFLWDYALAWHIASDMDADGISDIQDNCPNDANASQVDLDGDGLGDACDADIDGDGVSNTLDAFPYDPTETIDTDADGIGNNADTDDDNDGLSDIFELSIGTNTLLADSDGDGLSDYLEVAYDGDAATYTVGADLNPLSIDTDQDGVTDSADPIPLNYNFADGDIGPLGNPDGLVNNADLVIMSQIMIGQISAGVTELSHVDLYPPGAPDGVIDLSDMVLFQQLILQ